MITLSVPDAAMLERLSPAPEGARIIQWDFVAPTPADIDIAVLPYMAEPGVLAALEGRAGIIAQAQMLGFDGVEAHLPAGVVYCNAVEVHEASSAELALALVLASQRGLPVLGAAQREQRWAFGSFPGLAMQRVLLLGVGGVGREIEQRLEPFDVRLTRVGRAARDGVHGIDELSALLPEADIVILAVPGTAATRGLVDAAFLAAMPDGALLVNIARGPVVDTDALLAELTAGRLRAALDVTDPEPLPADHPLWTAPNTIITPHVGGNTGAMAPRIDRLVREQLRRALAGEPPKNVVHRGDTDEGPTNG